MKEKRKKGDTMSTTLAELTEKPLETIEIIRLLQLVENRDNFQAIPFEDFVAEEGFTMKACIKCGV